MHVKKPHLVIILILLIVTYALGQENILNEKLTTSYETQKIDTTYEDSEPEESDGNRYFQSTNSEVILSIGIFSVFLGVFLLEFILIRSHSFSEDNTVKLLVITMVIFGSIFLIIASYDEKFIAPAFALFGTICGYIFGKTQ